MRNAITRTARQVAEATGSIVGKRQGTEEPAYHSVERLASGVEIRSYGPRIVAETVVAEDEMAARSTGFRRLAAYIFGGNHSIAGGRRGEKIAMTMPVSQTAAGAGEWAVRFFMPGSRTTESLPEPDNPAVRLVDLPAETVAVLRFSGRRDSSAIAAQTAILLARLRARGIEDVGEPAAWFFDPPWTVPMLRRNEIAVSISISK